MYLRSPPGLSTVSRNQMVGKIDGRLDADDEVVLCAGDQVKISDNDLFFHPAEVF